MTDKSVRMANIARCYTGEVPLQKQIEEDVAKFGVPTRPEQGATLNTAGPIDLWDESGLRPTTGNPISARSSKKIGIHAIPVEIGTKAKEQPTRSHGCAANGVHPICTVAPLCRSRAHRVLGGLIAHFAGRV